MDAYSDVPQKFNDTSFVNRGEEKILLSAENQIKIILFSNNAFSVKTFGIGGLPYSVKMVFSAMTLISYINSSTKKGQIWNTDSDCVVSFTETTKDLTFEETNYFSCVAYIEDETCYCIYSRKSKDIFYIEYESFLTMKFKQETVLTEISNEDGVVVEGVKITPGLGMNGYGIALVSPMNEIYVFSFDVDESTSEHKVIMTNIVKSNVICNDITLMVIQLDCNENVIVYG